MTALSKNQSDLDLSCLILAGGESKRFGENKALYKFDGTAMLERAVSVALDLSSEIVISMKNKDQELQYKNVVEGALKSKFGDEKPKNVDIKFITDDCECGLVGPLRGFYSSMHALSGSFALVMECDAPFFTADAAKELVEKAKSENVAAVVPMHSDSTVEPLLCVYKKEYLDEALSMLHDYSSGLKKDFLFNDAVNLLRFLPAVYYYNVEDILKNNDRLSYKMFLNLNSKNDIEYINCEKKIDASDNVSESVKIVRDDKFFNIKNPNGASSGSAGNALYFWWVYATTQNFIYFKRAIEYFKEDSALYKTKGLEFMGNKLLKILPDINGILNIRGDLI